MTKLLTFSELEDLVRTDPDLDADEAMEYGGWRTEPGTESRFGPGPGPGTGPGTGSGTRLGRWRRRGRLRALLGRGRRPVKADP